MSCCHFHPMLRSAPLGGIQIPSRRYRTMSERGKARKPRILAQDVDSASQGLVGLAGASLNGHYELVGTEGGYVVLEQMALFPESPGLGS